MGARSNNGMKALAPKTEAEAERQVRKIDSGTEYGLDFEQHGGRSRHGHPDGPGSKNRGPKSSDERY